MVSSSKSIRPGIRFSYLQPDEVLLARDLLDRQIVDTQGMKVVRVNDLKLSTSVRNCACSVPKWAFVAFCAGWLPGSNALRSS